MLREIPVSADRREALQAILASRTFRRAEVLRRLLTYLVEQAELGLSNQTGEYEIGVNALGRPADFSPDSDSSVRTRMHALRQKLDEFYAEESLGAEIRIELPRGSYIPEFVRNSTQPPRTPRRRWPWIAASIIALGAAALTLRPDSEQAALASLWKPLLESKQAVAIVVGQPVHLWVRDIVDEPADVITYPHFTDAVPSSQRFLDYYNGRRPLTATSRLVLHPSPNATLWGDAAGAGAAARFLAFRGVNSELIPEATLKSEIAIKGRPLLVFGRPEFSDVVRRYLLAANGYTAGMLSEIRQYAIYRVGQPAERFLNTSGLNEVNHGLVTVLNDGSQRVMVFSGVTSDGAMAGIDYLTSPEALKMLRQRFVSEGLADWPRVFQVVIRTTSSRGYALGAAYEKHLVLQR